MAKSKSFSGPYGAETGSRSDTFESSTSGEESDTFQFLVTPQPSRSRTEIFGRQTSQPALHSTSRRSSVMEVTIYDIRVAGRIAEPHKIELQSYSTISIVAEATKIFGKIEESNVHLNFPNSCVVLLPQDSKTSRLILFIKCFCFENNYCKDTVVCVQADNDMKVKQLKEIIQQEFGWQGSEMYRGLACVPENDKQLQELGLNDFDELKALETAPIKVSFLYKISTDIDLRLSVNLKTSDSVKEVKEKIKTVFNEGPLFGVRDDSVIQIARKTEVLKDDHCFVLSQKAHKSEQNRIHVTTKNAVHCVLSYPKRRQRRQFESKAIIFVDPDKPTSSIRKEAAKFVGAEDKAIKLITQIKEPLEENKKAGEANNNMLHDGCKLSVTISKRLPILVKHPSKSEPSKVAELFPLDEVTTAKRLAASHYGIDELRIVLKCNGAIMQDNDLLQKYSLKKSTVLHMQIFERRIKVIVRIVFMRRKLALIIDDPLITTVEDILDYCAAKLQYRRSMSRCLLGYTCLDSSLSLQAAAVCHCNILNIVYFHEQEALAKGLFKLFQADQFGNITAGYGSIVGGILLQAHERSKPPQDGLQSDVDTNQKLPKGIHEVENSDLPKATGTEIRRAAPDLESCTASFYQSQVDYSSASSSSSGKDETCVKGLASSTSMHHQSVMKVEHSRPQFFVGEAESRNNVRSAMCKDTRPKISNELNATSATNFAIEKHAISERHFETDCHSDALKRQNTTEIRLLVRQSGAVSDTALSKVGKLMTDLSPEFERTGELLETAGIRTSLLEYVSRNVGADWKRLARKLKIEESDIEEIEHKYSSVSEACYKALILWKKQKGIRASKVWLVESLKFIKLNALAEKIEAMDNVADEPVGYKTE